MSKSRRKKHFTPAKRESNKANFTPVGEIVPKNSQGEKNPSPRDMDSLNCRVIQDPDSGAWWVEVTYEKFELGTKNKIAKT